MATSLEYLMGAIPRACQLGLERRGAPEFVWKEMLPMVFHGHVPGNAGFIFCKTFSKDIGDNSIRAQTYCAVNTNEPATAAMVGRECIIIHQEGSSSDYLDTQFGGASDVWEIEVRLPKPRPAADDILRFLEESGTLIAVHVRYTEPQPDIPEPVHSMVISVPFVCPEPPLKSVEGPSPEFVVGAGRTRISSAMRVEFWYEA